MGVNEDVLARAARVRLLLMDVDGVMTDGRYWQVPDAQGGLAEIKAFDSQDGIAFQWLRRFGIQAGVISGRVSIATEERARSAGFAHVYQGHTEKIPILEEILERSGLSAEQVGYVGDDFTDVVVMHRVGFAVAVANAKDEVKAHAHWVTTNAGGHGALRDVVELMLKAQGRWDEILKHYELLDRKP
jgi:3-deoxy-D-manno-octulosonate 8-phosphate phosphatase (KDO 8-P phosphatase)